MKETLIFNYWNSEGIQYYYYFLLFFSFQQVIFSYGQEDIFKKLLQASF